MQQTSQVPTAVPVERIDRKPSIVWKLLAFVALLVALVVDWVGMQLYLDGLRQRAYPSPRTPQLGNIQLAWSALALYLAMALFALAFAVLLPRVSRRAVQALGWFLGVGMVGLILMVPVTFVWMARSAPAEGTIVEPGGGGWDSPEELPSDGPVPTELDQPLRAE